MQKYTWPAVALHWIMALLVLGMLALGLYMAPLPKGPERSSLIALHKSIGLTLAVLLVVRFAWRKTHPPPAYPSSMPEWQKRLAHANAVALYAMLALQPLSGYLSSSFSGYKTSWFGVPLPFWGWESPTLNAIFNSIHVASSRVLMILIGLHLAAVAYHAFVRRDGVVRRMFFGKPA
jgi:cytochrome b561